MYTNPVLENDLGFSSTVKNAGEGLSNSLRADESAVDLARPLGVSSTTLHATYTNWLCNNDLIRWPLAFPTLTLVAMQGPWTSYGI